MSTSGHDETNRKYSPYLAVKDGCAVILILEDDLDLGERAVRPV